MHKEEKIDLNQLGTHFQIEVSIKAQESGENNNPNISSVDMVKKSTTFEGEKRKGNQASSSQKGKPQRPLNPRRMLVGYMKN